MAYRLFTTYFESPLAGRQMEIVACLEINVSAFDMITVLSDGPAESPLVYYPCDWNVERQRQTFARLFELAAFAAPDDIVIIANSDIAVTRNTLCLIAANLQRDEAYCLSRWDFVPGRGCVLFDKDYSQDAWVFRGPPKRSIGGEYPLGFPGSDNKLAHEIRAAGYRLSNPSRDIRVYHPHVSRVRTSNRLSMRLPLPYLFVAPAKLGEPPTYRVPDKLPRKAGHSQI